MLNRRGFLAALTAAFVVDPERLLWVPGKKLISIAKPMPLELSSQSIDEYVRMTHEQAAQTFDGYIEVITQQSNQMVDRMIDRASASRISFYA